MLISVLKPRYVSLRQYLQYMCVGLLYIFQLRCHDLDHSYLTSKVVLVDSDSGSTRFAGLGSKYNRDSITCYTIYEALLVHSCSEPLAQKALNYISALGLRTSIATSHSWRVKGGRLPSAAGEELLTLFQKTWVLDEP